MNMFKTKTKKLFFGSIMFFLFLSFIPVANGTGIVLPNVNLPNGSTSGGEIETIEQLQPETTTTPTTNSGSESNTPTTTTPTTNSGSESNTPTTTTPTTNSGSGTGLVKCGNEGQAACTFNDFIDMIDGVIQFVMTSIVPPIAVVTVVIAAINLMTSSGDPGKLEQAKKTIIWIIFGLVVIYGAWAIVKGFIIALGGGGDALKFFKQ
jgi:type IV secretory pathway VirB2 component (pilin)